MDKFYRIIEISSSIDTIYGHVILCEDNSQIADFEFHIFELSFMAVIKIFPPYDNKGIGSDIFFTYYNIISSKYDLPYFTASWSAGGEFMDFANGMSTNLYLFRKHMNEGKSEVEAAFLTPTGKWLKRCGYTEAVIEKNNPDDVKVIFKKY